MQGQRKPHSPENSFLLDALARQNKIISEYVEAAGRLQNQSPSFVLALPEQRMRALDNEYKTFRKEIQDSPLYAARIVEILNCLSGTGSSFNVSWDGIPEEQREFIVRKVDFNDLYTSGFWQPVFETWVQIASANDGLFLPKHSLIVFYETGCGNCHNELEKLKSKYKLLTDNNIRVVSIAADTDGDVFAETATGLPWPDKLCDFKGFDGDNFLNYGIVGTPTFILTDGEGIIHGRYAQLKELLSEP